MQIAVCFFRQNALRRSAYYYTVHPRHSALFVVVHHTVRPSNISRTVCPRITTFYVDIHADQFHSHTGYDVTSYFQSEDITKKSFENAASDGFGWYFSRTI